MKTDILIIGAGPAGIQAAIHATRRGADTIVVGRVAKSKLGMAWVENLFCVTGEENGMEMLKRSKEQAERFGAFFVDADAISLEGEGGKFLCRLDNGEEISSKALVLSTGITRNKSNIEGEKDFIGRGVSYCADCDGPLFRDKRVAIVGGESAAYAAAESLLAFASEVYLIDSEGKMDDTKRNTLETSGVRLIGEKPVKISGEPTVEKLVFEDGSSLDVDGVFIEMGSRGLLELAMPLGIMPDQKGFIRVDRAMNAGMEGVFACGDITGPPLQVCKAIGEGCVAGLSVVEYLRTLRT
jgi:thioredoxin reductase (NADPH)